MNEFRLSNSAFGCLEKLKKLAEEVTMCFDDFNVILGDDWDAATTELARNGLIKRELLDISKNVIKLTIIPTSRERRNKYQKNLMRKRRNQKRKEAKKEADNCAKSANKQPKSKDTQKNACENEQ